MFANFILRSVLLYLFEERNGTKHREEAMYQGLWHFQGEHAYHYFDADVRVSGARIDNADDAVDILLDAAVDYARQLSEDMSARGSATGISDNGHWDWIDIFGELPASFAMDYGISWETYTSNFDAPDGTDAVFSSQEAILEETGVGEISVLGNGKIG